VNGGNATGGLEGGARRGCACGSHGEINWVGEGEMMWNLAAAKESWVLGGGGGRCFRDDESGNRWAHGRDSFPTGAETGRG
jgi:hypothetical protein